MLIGVHRVDAQQPHAQILEAAAQTAEGPAILGPTLGITWVDLCLAPLLSDLSCLPEGPPLLAACPRLSAWFAEFEMQDVFLQTAPESLAVARQTQRLQRWALAQPSTVALQVCNSM
jgi:hypothetical protein